MTIRYPDGKVLLRKLDRDFPLIVRGEGPYLYDEEGQSYYDACGGALVVSLGHGNQEIVRKISEQLSNVAYINGTQFTSAVTEKLAELLSAKARNLSSDPRRFSFLCSGSEAVEAAVKFARQLWYDRGEDRRVKVISRTPGYHGNTLFALSASGRPHYKKMFGPLLHEVITVSTPYEYRPKFINAQGYADELEQAIQKNDPATIAAFLFEPISGTSAGGSVPPEGYFQKIKEVCDRHGVLMIADEVLCGAGRTGKFFACEHFGFDPDILVLGKGVGGGYAPLSVVMVRERHVEEMRRKSGLFMHAQTYMQAPFVTAAGVAALEYFEKHGVLQNTFEKGTRLLKGLREKLHAHPNVGAVMGCGLLAGIEFVDDKPTKKPFDRKKKTAEKFADHAFQKGLVIWSNVGQVDGVNGDLAVLGPPLTITGAQVEELLDRFTDCVESFFSK